MNLPSGGALGASRLRLARQSITESLLLSLLGGAIGCLFARILIRLFVSIAPEGIPRLDQASVDLRVLLFALAIACLSGILFGLAPVFHVPSAGISPWQNRSHHGTLLPAPLSRDRADRRFSNPACRRRTSPPQPLESRVGASGSRRPTGPLRAN